MEFLAQNALEVVSILIAACALLYAILAFTASKQAIKATKEANVTALKVKAQDAIADAQRSLLSLQEACLLTRRDWENHASRHFPTFGDDFGRSFFSEPKETQHISQIERRGSKALGDLMSLMPKSDVSACSEWHQFIAKAQCSATQIESLKLGLERPKPLHH